MMNFELFLSRFEATPNTVGSLLQSVPLEVACWKPNPEAWSILEVVCHMADEERKDFRPRLKSLMFDNPPGSSITPLNPPAWIVEGKYNTRDLTDSLSDFQIERQQSLGWLRSLPTDLQLERTAPDRDITAGQVLYSWLGHDYLHIRQITRLHYDFLALETQAYDIGYAGDWR
jgi:DinB superfamily